MLVVLQLGLGALHRVDVPRTHINATAVAEWQAGLKMSKVDYLFRPYTAATGPWSEEVLTAALERLPPPSTRYVAGIIYAQIGPWPPWSEYLALAAHANRANVAFYFLGPQLPFDIGGRCSNCVWLPLDLPLMRRRVETILNFSSGTIRMDSRKMCDLKPLWAALFPEIAGRHAWIGYADSDILFGNLSSEVAELQPEDEILTPSSFFPHPISNGAFLLVRSEPKLVHAYVRSRNWRKLLLDRVNRQFDEWGSHPDYGSMAEVYLTMGLAGELRARPTRRLFVQDTIFRRHSRHILVNQMTTHTTATWRRGALLFERRGGCVCADDSAANFGVSMCHECVKGGPGAVFADVITHRKLEVLALHFQTWKKHWRRNAFDVMSESNGTWPDALPHPTPQCPAGGHRTVLTFVLLHGGFVCSPPWWEGTPGPAEAAGRPRLFVAGAPEITTPRSLGKAAINSSKLDAVDAGVPPQRRHQRRSHRKVRRARGASSTLLPFACNSSRWQPPIAGMLPSSRRTAGQPPPRGSCFLEWTPWSKDAYKTGLLHQMASFGCAVGEAHALRRTLLLPAELCLQKRGPGGQRAGSSALCARTDELFDLPLLSKLMDVEVRARRADDIFPGRNATVGAGCTTRQVDEHFACNDGVTLLRRDLGPQAYWFDPCLRRVVNSSALVSRASELVGIDLREAYSKSLHHRLVFTLLRSGLFFAPRLKAVAAAIRVAIGSRYVAVHVRRGDKLRDRGVSALPLRVKDNLTQPDAVERALGMWLADGTSVYIGSTESPAFFAPLVASGRFRVFFAENFSSAYAAHGVSLSSNQQIFAVDLLVFLGADALVETFQSAPTVLPEQFMCFPAAPLRRQRDDSNKPLLQSYEKTLNATCPGRGAGVLVNGVHYGPACFAEPPCKLALIRAGTTPLVASPQPCPGGVKLPTPTPSASRAHEAMSTCDALKFA